MARRAARDAIFDCPGEMAERLATLDWAGTSLGPVDQWPESLRTTCALMLRSRFPMILSWGPELLMLYNDAYIPTLRAKHPDAVGSPLSVQFAEIWDAVGPMQLGVLAGGEATYFEDMPLVIDWGQGPEASYFTFSYSHVPDPGSQGGVLTLFADVTGKVVGGRRLALLNALASQPTEVANPDKALAASLDLLGRAGDDLVFGAAFLPTPGGGLLQAGTFGEGPAGWDPRQQPGIVAAAWSGNRVVVDPDPTGLVALPIRTRDAVSAVLLVAPHPLRPLDDDHRRFLDLLGDQLSKVVTLATARADEQSRLAALAAIDTAKSELLSSVSHEFRTPLTLLLGPLEDAMGGRPDALDEATVTAMHQGAHRLLRMVNDLLDVARLDAGGDVVDTEPTDVAGLTEELLAPFVGAAARSGLSFEQRIDHAIGAVELDPRLWEKILLNLVSNAVKYTQRGGITVELAADAPREEGPGELVLRVADTGIGIPEEELGRVFERFHRVEAGPGRSIDGTGLGLALVAEAAHAQGGTSRVTSRRDEGSSFEVRLPLLPVDGRAAVPAADRRSPGAEALAGELAAPLSELLVGVPAADAARSGAALPAQPPAWLEPDPAGATILVVDDNHAMRARLGRVLGELGRVVTCANGEEALAVLRHAPVDLVVTDVMMPRLDGVGLLEAIRADATIAPTPVVVLSARAGAEAATGALEAGADDYVVKPFTRGELLARCRTSLELARLRAEATAARTRSTLIAGVSHDMQTPLSVIRTVLELLSEPDVDDSMRAQLSARALPRARHLERLIGQFLDWSRLAVGTPLKAQREATDLAALVREVVAEYPEASFSPPPEQPEQPLLASCDRPRTQQILHNLIGNGVRVARSGVAVQIRPVEPGRGSAAAGPEVVVRDDGLGIDEHVLPHLFAPFGTSRGAEGRGSGLGLHVSREAARAQGGDLVLESTGDRGTTFVLRVLAEV